MSRVYSRFALEFGFGLAVSLPLSLLGCAGHAQSGDQTGPGTGNQGDGTTSSLELMRSVPQVCEQAVSLACANNLAEQGCWVHARQLIDNATQAGCIKEAAQAFNCVATSTNVCDSSGNVTSPDCASAVQSVNDCILAATDWDAVSCGSFHEPDPRGGDASCLVNCSNLSANCISNGAGLDCTCTSGLQMDSTFATDNCPPARELAENCNFETVL